MPQEITLYINQVPLVLGVTTPKQLMADGLTIPAESLRQTTRKPFILSALLCTAQGRKLVDIGFASGEHRVDYQAVLNLPIDWVIYSAAVGTGMELRINNLSLTAMNIRQALRRLAPGARQDKSAAGQDVVLWTDPGIAMQMTFPSPERATSIVIKCTRSVPVMVSDEPTEILPELQTEPDFDFGQMTAMVPGTLHTTPVPPAVAVSARLEPLQTSQMPAPAPIGGMENPAVPVAMPCPPMEEYGAPASVPAKAEAQSAPLNTAILQVAGVAAPADIIPPAPAMSVAPPPPAGDFSTMPEMPETKREGRGGFFRRRKEEAETTEPREQTAQEWDDAPPVAVEEIDLWGSEPPQAAALQPDGYDADGEQEAELAEPEEEKDSSLFSLPVRIAFWVGGTLLILGLLAFSRYAAANEKFNFLYDIRFLNLSITGWLVLILFATVILNALPLADTRGRSRGFKVLMGVLNFVAAAAWVTVLLAVYIKIILPLF